MKSLLKRLNQIQERILRKRPEVHFFLSYGLDNSKGCPAPCPGAEAELELGLGVFPLLKNIVLLTLGPASVVSQEFLCPCDVLFASKACIGLATTSEKLKLGLGFFAVVLYKRH